MRGNPHVRFLEGKMAVMSSSYSTCTSVRKACASRKAAQYPSHYASGRTARYRQDISEKKGLCRLHRRGQRVCLDRRRNGPFWSPSAQTKATPAATAPTAAPTREPIPCSPRQRAKARTGAASTRSRRSSGWRCTRKGTWATMSETARPWNGRALRTAVSRQRSPGAAGRAGTVCPSSTMATGFCREARTMRARGNPAGQPSADGRFGGQRRARPAGNALFAGV